MFFLILPKITRAFLKSTMNILHIIKSLGRGGAEMLLPETLKLHDRQHFNFHYIYFLPWKDQMVASLEQEGGKVVCFAANNNIQLILKVNAVARYVRDHKIELIHAHLPWAGILARIVGRITGVPVIYTEHNKQERYHWSTRAMNLLTMNWLTTVVAVSGDVAESIRKHKPQLKTRLTTILNGVNTDHFNKASVDATTTRTKLDIPADALVIGTVAVFRFQKRLDLWLELAARIREKHPQAHFVIVGDGPLKKELLEKRASLNLTDFVHMPGLETEVRPFLAMFDLYMMCSVFEGLPIALLEAMAMECAVVSTDAGGIKEVIRQQVDGWLCSVDNPHDLVDMTATLLSEEDQRTHYGRQARKRVVEAFSMKKMVSELEALYNGLKSSR
jgi:glycosyltransferase involved in cell wall biosynthesis